MHLFLWRQGQAGWQAYEVGRSCWEVGDLTPIHPILTSHSSHRVSSSLKIHGRKGRGKDWKGEGWGKQLENGLLLEGGKSRILTSPLTSQDPNPSPEGEEGRKDRKDERNGQ